MTRFDFTYSTFYHFSWLILGKIYKFEFGRDAIEWLLNAKEAQFSNNKQSVKIGQNATQMFLFERIVTAFWNSKVCFEQCMHIFLILCCYHSHESGAAINWKHHYPSEHKAPYSNTILTSIRKLRFLLFTRWKLSLWLDFQLQYKQLDEK